MTISYLRRAGVTVLLAGAALLLAPVPAHAETVCQVAPNGAQYCYDNGAGGGIGGSNTGSAGGAPVSGGYGAVPPPPPRVQAPAPQPAPAPAPAYQAPAPVQAPAPAPKAPVNGYVAPKTSPGYQAPAPVLAPVPQYGPAVGADTGPAPAAPAPAPAEVPVEAAPVPSTTAEAAVAATPTATPSPTASASATPEPATVSADQASSTEGFNPAPVLILGGVLLAAALAWFVRPVRGAVARVLARGR